MITSVPGCDSALDHLAAADARAPDRPWRSLAPGRDEARSLLDIGRSLLADEARSEAAYALVEGLGAVVHAMRQAFPDNIFGDLDYLAGSLWRDAKAASEGAVPFLRAQCDRIVALQALFGRGTVIRFRYVHDFVYGFDWAKWVARDPAARASAGPFSPEFLTSMDRRGHELLEIIDRGDDRTYPPLLDPRPRNPFGFSREPDAEIALHRRLAIEGLIPVEVWDLEAQPRWDRPYAELRRRRAMAMGLGIDVGPS